MWEKLLDKCFKQELIRQHVTHGPVYMKRWVIFRLWGLRLYIHKFIRPDTNREPHDHPCRFLSFCFKGSYIERRWSAAGTRYADERRKAPSIAYRNEYDFHRIDLLREGLGTDYWTAVRQLADDESLEWCPDHKHWYRHVPCWTLVLMLPNRKPWGFMCKPGVVMKSSDYIAVGGCV